MSSTGVSATGPVVDDEDVTMEHLLNIVPTNLTSDARVAVLQPGDSLMWEWPQWQQWESYFEVVVFISLCIFVET